LAEGDPIAEFVSATADIRGDYRYSLTRVWDPTLPPITYVLMRRWLSGCRQCENVYFPSRRGD
jgi:hypothetical protein